MDINQYIGKNILAWLSYKEDYEEHWGTVNRVCYVYPRVLVQSDSYDLIDSNDFPNLGAIEVRIQGEDSAEDVHYRFGSLVSIKINKTGYPNYDAKNWYSLKYNAQFGKTNSEIWIESFSGKGLYQIIDVDTDIATLQKHRSIPEPGFDIKTTLVLLRIGNRLFGPFEYDSKEGNMTLRGVKELNYSVGEYNALDCNDELLIFTDNNGEEVAIFVPRSSRVSPEFAENTYDWISEETLMDGFINSLRVENGYTREQVRQLKDRTHQHIENAAGMSFTEERIQRIRSILDDIEKVEDKTQAMVEYALSNEATKQRVLKELVENHFDQIETQITELSGVQERVSQLKSQEVAIEQHIREMETEAEKEKMVSSADDRKEIERLNEKIRLLENEKTELVEIVDTQKNIESLREECENLKKDRERALEAYNQQLIDNRSLENQFNDTLEEFNNRAKQTARILDSKLLDKILRGVGEDPITETQEEFDPSQLHSAPMSYSEIISRVTTYINDRAHRDVTTNDVANYLICISQGFITTFAGEPGTGKTSLCNILANALGLVVDSQQKRFVDISVERGWASHKDFIGYYNPLTKNLEKSNNDVYNAFSRLNNECHCDQDSIAPFLILLDEANLSPIEHYWAAFLRNCDFASSSNRSISLGGNLSFDLPEHLRFLATVNFDHTTEELSPRFLDRSWVIVLDPTRIDYESEERIENYEDMIPFSSMRKAFCVGENDMIDEAIENKWNAIQRIFREKNLQIMPRNLKMVKNYCAVGCRCMERDTPTTRLAPLDYAFSQKILPTINGSGENYQNLIDELLKECTAQNMPISEKHLQRMKRASENNMGFVQFFSH